MRCRSRAPSRYLLLHLVNAAGPPAGTPPYHQVERKIPLLHPKNSFQRSPLSSPQTAAHQAGPPDRRPRGPGGHGAGEPGGLAPLGTWSCQRPRGSLALSGAVESGVNHSFQGLGVSYGQEAGRGCGFAGAAHRDGSDPAGAGAGSPEERRGGRRGPRRRWRPLGPL